MKMVREPTRVIASVFALCGFVVAMVAGWKAQASTTHIMVSAIVAMLGCKAIGLWAGWAGERAIREFLANYHSANPIPTVKGAARGTSAAPRTSNVDKTVKKAGNA